MQSRRVFSGLKGNKEGSALLVKEEVIPSAEIHEKMKPSLERCSGVMHDKLLEISVITRIDLTLIKVTDLIG